MNSGEHILSLFVSFEGPEGCGKTTQMHLLAAHLRQLGLDVLTTREPGGTAIGDQVRSILLDPDRTEMHPTTEFLLFSAARAQHVEEVIRPRLAQGTIVLCDRFADSSLAYQGHGYRRDLETLQAITRFATGGLEPDVTLLLDVPVEVGLRRKAHGSGDSWNRMEQKDIVFHEQVRQGYLRMAAEGSDRWIVVDARGELDEVHAQVMLPVLARLGFGT
jgi:dTMP kinase